MGDGSGETDGIEDGAAADDDDVAASVEVGRMNALEHPLDDVDVVLDGLAAGDCLDVARHGEAVGMAADEGANPRLEIGLGLGDVFVEPELDACRLISRRLEQVGQDLLVGAEDVLRKPQAVDEGNLEGDVVMSGGVRGRIRHVAVTG